MCRVVLSPSVEHVLASVHRIVDAVVSTSAGIPSIAALLAVKHSSSDVAVASTAEPTDTPMFLLPFPGSPDVNAARQQLRLTLADTSVSSQNLPPITATSSVVEFARGVVSVVVQQNLKDVQTVLQLYAPFEYLLSEASRLDTFLAKQPSLEDCEAVLADVSALVCINRPYSYVLSLTAASQYRAVASEMREVCPHDLPLDLFLVRCCSINNILRECVDTLIEKLMAYVERYAFAYVKAGAWLSCFV